MKCLIISWYQVTKQTWQIVHLIVTSVLYDWF